MLPPQRPRASTAGRACPQDVPSVIDFVSLDTEGSELAILKAFPFDQYTVRTVAVEHNFVEPRRTQMRALLEAKGLRHVALSGRALADTTASYRGPVG